MVVDDKVVVVVVNSNKNGKVGKRRDRMNVDGGWMDG